MSKNKRILKEFTLFAFVGGIAFVVDVSILYSVKTDIGLYWGRVVSFFCAVIVTWILNRELTFRRRISDLSMFSEFKKYLTIMIGGGALNYILYATLLNTMENFAFHPIWAVAIGSNAGMIFNFIFLQNTLFSKYRK